MTNGAESAERDGENEGEEGRPDFPQESDPRVWLQCQGLRRGLPQSPGLFTRNVAPSGQTRRLGVWNSPLPFSLGLADCTDQPTPTFQTRGAFGGSGRRRLAHRQDPRKAPAPPSASWSFELALQTISHCLSFPPKQPEGLGATDV